MEESQILFKFHVETTIGQSVRIVGDNPQLGCWDPKAGLRLSTKPNIYPFWISNEIIMIPKDKRINFKCVVIENEIPIRWEEKLEDNRKHKAQHKKVILRGYFNDPKLVDIVEEDFPDQIKILTSRPLLQSFTNYDPLKSADKSESDADSGEDLLSTKLLLSKFKGDEKSKTKDKLQTPKNNLNDIPQNNNNENNDDSEEYEEDSIQEEINDSKMKNIVNISSNQKNYLEQYNQFCDPNLIFSPLFQHNITKEVPDNQIFDKDSIFQSYFKQMKENNQLKSIYTKLNSNNDIMYELNQDIILHLDENVPIILASLFLPIYVKIDEMGAWNINLMLSNFNSILFQLLNENSIDFSRRKNFKWVGFIPYDSKNLNFTLEKQNILIEELFDKYNCIAILIDDVKINDFIKNFYNKYFENIISNIVEEDYTQVFNFSEDYWNFFREINKMIASKIVTNLDDNSLVYIIDYRIFLTVGMLSYTSSKTSIGLFWDHSFPTLENFKYLPFKHEMLLSILCSNVICFLDFRYARSFFSVAKSFLGLDYQTNRGVLFILYLGRQIIIKISSQIPDFNTIRKLQRTPEYKNSLERWKDKFGDSEVILAINSLDILNLTILKFELIHDFILAKKGKYKLKFVQVIQKESYDEMIEYSNNMSSINEIYKLINDMNKMFEEEIFIVIEEKLNTADYLALMSISKVFIRAQIKPKNLFKCLEFLLANNDYSVVMISEFACYSKLCKSFATFNLFKKTDFIDKLDSILSIENKETLRCNTMIDHEYFKENSSLTWLDNCLLDLLQTSNMIKYAQISSISMGSQYLKVLTNKRFKHLDSKLTLNNYLKKNSNRLIIFDVDGTLLPQDKYSHFEFKKSKASAKYFQTPDEKVITNVKKLAQDPKNTVFLITGKGLDEFCSYFKMPQLGLACEYGYLLKDCPEQNWIRLCQLDLSWKEKAKSIVQRFVENTELSLMIEKESAIVWKYGDVDKEMGAKQCEQLHKELKEQFENNADIDFVVSKDYLEVRPFGMNKGTFTEILIKKIYEEKGKIDFILIIGNGLSDEEMFVAAKKNLKYNSERFAPKTAPYLCVVGKRPSNAFYYVRDHMEVTNLIENFVREKENI